MFSGIKSVWEAVTNLPQLIGNALSSSFEAVKNAVLSLPNLILDGIKSIFIPDTNHIKDRMDSFVDEMGMKFAFDTEFFEDLFQAEKPVEDIDMDYNISGVGDFKLKVLDTSFFVQGVTYFRPFIRGFLVLLMLLYHIRQLIGFFGYDAGVIAGRQEWVAYTKTNTGGHKE